ncbi:MAG: Holliday junction DNA helicase RuvB [Verrucomicrobiales bacterium]|jgi:Holliday junction DNA helicase RuvB
MLLKPKLRDIAIDPDLRTRIEADVFETLFAHVDRYLKPEEDAVPVISLVQAREILAASLPLFQESIAAACKLDESPEIPTVAPARETIQLFKDGAAEMIGYLRREGASPLRAAVARPPAGDGGEFWSELFQNRLRSVVEGSGYLLDRDKRETCDLAVESLKIWQESVIQQLLPLRGIEWSPTQLFLDTETELDGVIDWDGRKLRLRGRPDALLVNPGADPPEVIDVNFLQAGKTELQIANLLFYIRLIAAIRGPGIEAGRLQLIEFVSESDSAGGSSSPIPPRIEQAFNGYIGNTAAVRRIKIEATVALKSNDGAMPVNLLFSGPGGLGKTELARRVADALGDLPLIDLPASRVKSIDELLDVVNRELESRGQIPQENGTDSGLPSFLYPPLVIFLDEVHLLGQKADNFLNLFEPNEKRAVGKDLIGDFSAATILAATTDRGKLPDPFLTRFRAIDLVSYSPDEVARIVRPIFGEQDPGTEFLESLATMSRLNPRTAKEHAEEFRTHHSFDESEYPLTIDGLEKVANEAWGVDQLGLAGNDRMYFQALGDGPKGFGALTTILPIGKEEIQNQIEPYLIQLGLICQTTVGRQLTEKGRVYLLGS